MKQLNNFIDNHDTFLLFGHEDPDADCICSQVVFSRYLNSLGKKTHVYATMPFTRKELFPYEKFCTPEFSPADAAGKTAAILLDCSTAGRTGKFADTVSMFPKAVIDHHDSVILPADVPVLIDSNAPSTTYLVLHFLQENSYKPDLFESKTLFLGLCTDTGFFRHLQENSGSALRAAAELCDLGASPNETFYSIYGNKSAAARKLLALLLSRTETFYDGSLIVTYEKLSDFELFNPTDRDNDMLYQLLLGTSGVKIAAFFKEENPGKCSVSLRTREEIDLSLIAAHFGGGGHKKASGYSTGKSIAEAVKEFTAYAGSILA